jgi:hypothetical protein
MVSLSGGNPVKSAIRHLALLKNDDATTQELSDYFAGVSSRSTFDIGAVSASNDQHR